MISPEHDDFDDNDLEDDDELDLAQNRLAEPVESILKRADHFEVLFLDPNEGPEEGAANGLHGWPILGRILLQEPTTRQELLAALARGLAAWDGAQSECLFEPRHAIHARAGRETVDVIICFECDQVAVYLGNDKTQFLYLEVWGRTRPIFDRIYRGVGLPLAD